MSNIVLELHQLFNQKKRFSFPFEEFTELIPNNGIYIIFEREEKYENLDRIVRVGTHTGNNQLRSRLNQHFVNENKNRSIFRKNIGRCLLNKDNHPYLKEWEYDITSRANREEYEEKLNREFEKELEKAISKHIQTNLSFCVFEVSTENERIYWERKIASTLAQDPNKKQSENWLGQHSTKSKIKESGLWQVNELNKTPLTEIEFIQLKNLVLRINRAFK
jgi:hypothetical protein